MSEAEAYINDIPKFAGKTELSNTVRLLEELGVCTDDMKIIHVAGTNGKGSVCSYISTTLKMAGKRTGLFISPHLVRINERIQIDNEPVNDELFDAAYRQVRSVSERMARNMGRHPAYFEFIFGMAMLIFKQQNVEYVVLETGLGGRLDSTNVIEKPVMTVITSVSYDHMHVLGDTIEQIAAEKAGIIKPQVPLVFFGGNERVRRVIEERAAQLNAPCSVITPDNISHVEKKGKFIDFSLTSRYYDNETFSVGSAAYYQTENAALAAEALAQLAEDDDSLNSEVIKTGIRSSFWEGRMEEVAPDVFVDGAHNEDGIRAFLETASVMKDKPQLLMFSVVADKDYDSMIKEICQSMAFSSYVICPVSYDRRMADTDSIGSVFSKYTDAKVTVRENVKDALIEALRQKGEGSRLFVAGSLYLVGEVKALILDMKKEGCI